MILLVCAFWFVILFAGQHRLCDRSQQEEGGGEVNKKSIGSKNFRTNCWLLIEDYCLVLLRQSSLLTLLQMTYLKDRDSERRNESNVIDLNTNPNADRR